MESNSQMGHPSEINKTALDMRTRFTRALASILINHSFEETISPLIRISNITDLPKHDNIFCFLPYHIAEIGA